MHFFSVYNDPVIYDEAMTGNNADDWKVAMDDEILSFKKNLT
jgi:hypothetical protein